MSSGARGESTRHDRSFVRPRPLFDWHAPPPTVQWAMPNFPGDEGEVQEDGLTAVSN